MEVIIVGAGVGGLTLALGLHEIGVPVRVYETSPEIGEIGVGVTLLPHCVKVLGELGLVDHLAKLAVTTKVTVFFNRFGQRIHSEPTGRYAGYEWPQFQAHRADLITVLHEVHNFDLKGASTALTAYMAGATGGILVGGWAADRVKSLLAFAIVAAVVAACLILTVAWFPMAQVLTCVVLCVAGILIGASRTPRDMMVKDASPPGQIGKVFGFVSAGLPLGNAITPVPFGFLIDAGRPDLVLVLVAVILVTSLLFIGSARVSARPVAVPVAAE